MKNNISNKNNLPIIATDLDSIICDTDLILRKALQKFFKIKIKRKDITDYKYENCLNISDSDFEKFWKWFVKQDFWEQIPLVRNAKKTLKKISKKYQIYVFTSRPSDLKDITKSWIIKKKLNFIDRIYHVDILGLTKLSAIENIKIKPIYYIEDRLDFAEEVAKKHKVLLYDYPWNQNSNHNKNLIRVKNWQEISEIIFKN